MESDHRAFFLQDMVTKDDVLAILAHADESGVTLFLDGGWGVDALLGEQTRQHDDIDLFLEREQGMRFIGTLKRHGFVQVLRSYTTADHTVWEDAEGRIVDLHLFEYESDDTIRFEDGVYPAATFGATGRIGDRIVRCIPPAEQVAFHCGYDYDADDMHDVRLLCERFGIPLPEAYRNKTD